MNGISKQILLTLNYVKQSYHQISHILILMKNAILFWKLIIIFFLDILRRDKQNIDLAILSS